MFFFFFSSRRRHTRCSRDWSSDVCSSDLAESTITSNLNSEISRAQGAESALSTSISAESSRAQGARSEEHTSELQSRLHLVCRLLLEKKKKTTMQAIHLPTHPSSTLITAM